MPRERVNASGNNGWTDLTVAWSKLGTHDQIIENQVDGQHVRIYPTAKELPGYGGFYSFTPENAEQFNSEAGSSFSPVSIDLDRTQINRLIRVLRTARDAAYGSDA